MIIQPAGNPKSSSWLSAMPARSLSLLILLILPLLLLPTAFSIRKASGPFWFAINLDPNYPYLMNSLNLANFRRPYNMEPHPGVPIQAIGGATIRLLNPTADQATLAREVATNSEFYLRSISNVFIFLASACLIVVGLVTFRVTNSILSSLLLQFTPWMSVSTMEGLFGVRPEPFFVSVCILFSALVLLTLRFDIGKYALRYCIAFGVLSGLGMASKINFLPLLVVPLILLRSWKWRAVYSLATAASFLVFIVPILTPGHLQRMLGFAFNISTRTGPYGSGTTGFLGVSRLFANLQVLVTKDWPFFVVVLVGVLALSLRSRIPALNDTRRRILLAVIVAEFLQIGLVVRQPESRYLIPALGLIGVNLVVMFEALKQQGGFGNTQARYATVILICTVLIVIQAVGFLHLLRKLRTEAENERSAFERVESEFKDTTVVEYYSSSSHSFALKFGSEYSGNLYSPVLAKLYPDRIFYNLWTSQFSRFEGPVDANQIVPSGHSFIMRGYDLSVPDFRKFLPVEFLPPNLNLEPVYRSRVDVPGVFEEAIYRAKFQGSN